MIDENAKKIIEENPVAVATIDGGNKPNVIAVAYVKVVSDNEIIITDNYMTKTKENIQANPNICLATWDKDWNGYKIIGTAEYFSSGKWFDFIKSLPENKGCPAKGAILINIAETKELR